MVMSFPLLVSTFGAEVVSDLLCFKLQAWCYLDLSAVFKAPRRGHGSSPSRPLKPQSQLSDQMKKESVIKGVCVLSSPLHLCGLKAV